MVLRQLSHNVIMNGTPPRAWGAAPLSKFGRHYLSDGATLKRTIIMALTSDGKTVMILMRTDGDGPCHRPYNYFQSYSPE